MTQEWYSGDNRQARIREAIERNELDALLALTPENAHYLAGFGNFVASYWRLPGLFAVVIGANGEKAVVSGEFGRDPQAPESDYTAFPYTSWTESVDVRNVNGETIAERIQRARPDRVQRPAQFDLDEVFARIGEAVHHVAPHAKRIGVDLIEVDVRSLGRLQHELGDRAILAADGVFDDLRAVKDQDEIEQLRLACELTEHGIDESAKQLHIGQSALAVNSAYHIAVHQSAIAKPRFSQFRQSGGNATLGLGITDSGPVTAGRTVKFDMEVDVGGYHSDLGRTYVIEPTVDQIAVYDALRHALHDMISAVEPGITFDRLFAIGSEAMYQAGFSNYSRGHLGHSDGLTRHFEESPFIAPGEHRPLVPNMVLSLELPYYLYGVGAFQLERMVLVTEDGYDIMDSLPFTLAVEH